MSNSVWLMDDHNPLWQPPCPDKGPIDIETIPLRHRLNPLDEERACQLIHDKHTLLGLHKPLYCWSLDGPLINISGKRYKYPIQTSINSTPQRLGKRSKYICRHLTPTKVQKKSSCSHTLIFYYFSSHSNPSNFSIGGFVVGTTPVFHTSSFYHPFFRIRLVMDDPTLDDHFDWRSKHHQFGAVYRERFSCLVRKYCSIHLTSSLA